MNCLVCGQYNIQELDHYICRREPDCLCYGSTGLIEVRDFIINNVYYSVIVSNDISHKSTTFAIVNADKNNKSTQAILILDHIIENFHSGSIQDLFKYIKYCNF